MLFRYTLLLILSTFAFVGRPALAQRADWGIYAIITIDRIGAQALQNLKARQELIWWVELEDQLLVRTSFAHSLALAADFKLTRLNEPVNDSFLSFVARLSPAKDQGRILASGGRFSVVYHDPEQQVLPKYDAALDHDRFYAPFQPFTVLACQTANRSYSLPPGKTEGTEALLAEINAVRWFKAMRKLSCFNRYSLGEGIHDARDWLVSEFSAIPGFHVSLQSFPFDDHLGENVVAVLEGTEQPDVWFVAGAHYDAISENAAFNAPGAEDNASGVAGLLEMAHAFAAYPPTSTLALVAFSAEEQGLFGSAAFAQSLLNQGVEVPAVINMDMIGYTNDRDLDCLLETSSSASPLMEACLRAAASYTRLRIIQSFSPFGSDHVSFLNRGLPAILTIENDWSQYPGYHRQSDTTRLLGLELGPEIIKMNLAALTDLMQ